MLGAICNSHKCSKLSSHLSSLPQDMFLKLIYTLYVISIQKTSHEFDSSTSVDLIYHSECHGRGIETQKRCFCLLNLWLLSHAASDKSLWKMLEILLPAWRVGQFWCCLRRRTSFIKKIILGHFWCFVSKGNWRSGGFICIDKATTFSGSL